MNIFFEELSEKYKIEVIDILNHYIENTTSAYRAEKVADDYYENLRDSSVLQAYVILSEEKEAIGFCTLEKYKSITTFRQVADVMYFIRPGFTGKGVGRKALERLESDAKGLGIKKIVVDLADDNAISIDFHKKNGFREYGRLENCWTKNGKDLGILFMEKDI